MKYTCNECGKTYNKRPNFCECGNDVFYEVPEENAYEQQSKPYSGSMKKNDVQPEQRYSEPSYEEEKTSPFTILFLVVVVALMAFFIPRIINQKANNSETEEKYLENVMKMVMSEFDPSGIRKSGFCLMQFEINEDGIVTKRAFKQRSTVPAINSKISYALRKTTMVEKPPQRYTNVPIRLKIMCTADDYAAECESGIMLDESVEPIKK